jgi:uncharacterized protein YceK
MRRIVIVVVLVALLIGIGWLVHAHPSDQGASRLYANQTYAEADFQNLADSRRATGIVGS